ncbi:MAG: hypothetical protein HFE63_01395 [Clostridiales bacterium]|nr:hypothetical protein [Clostridiales bacterium]
MNDNEFDMIFGIDRIDDALGASEEAGETEETSNSDSANSSRLDSAITDSDTTIGDNSVSTETDNSSDPNKADISNRDNENSTSDDNRQDKLAATSFGSIARRRAAFEQQRAQQQAIFRELGIVDETTGKPIATKEEYDAYCARAADKAKRDFLEAYGMGEDDYKRIVNQLPEVVEARRARAEAEQQLVSASAVSREAEAKAKIEGQMKQLAALDSSIKSIDDLMAMENYPQFYELVKRGNNFVEAYKLANYDNLIKRAAAAEKQRTLNSQSGKAHMTPARVEQGQGLPQVPSDELELYRYLNPGMSDDEIAKDHSKRVGSYKK